MNKRVLALFVCAILSVGLLHGCAQTEENDSPDYQDQAFLADLGKGLDARWDMIDTDAEDDPGRTTSAEGLKSYIQAELDYIGGYSEAQFENPELHELAISYINVLNDSLEAADSYSPSSLDSLQAWQSVYDERVSILRELLEGYDVKTSSEHDDDRNAIVADGKAVQQSESNDKAIQALADSVVFEFAPDEYGYLGTGKATVTNNTGFDLESVSFDVQLYDEAGVRVDSTSVYANNWKSGETVVLEAYTAMDAIPSSVKVVPGFYVISE